MARRNGEVIQLQVWATMLRPADVDSLVAVVAGIDRTSVVKKGKAMAELLSMPHMPRLIQTASTKGSVFALADAIELSKPQTVDLARRVAAKETVVLVWRAFQVVAECAEDVLLRPPERGWTMMVVDK